MQGKDAVVIGAVSEKGGSGKSTFLANLAVAHALAGRRVTILDTDTQETASDWAALRQSWNVAQIPCYARTGREVYPLIRELAEECDLLLVDVGGRAEDREKKVMIEVAMTLYAADHIFIPVNHSGAGLWTLKKMEQLIAYSKQKNARLKAFVLPALVSPQLVEKDVATIGAFLEEYGLTGVFEPLENAFSFRRPYVHAHDQGLSVLETTDRDGRKAREEMEELFYEIQEKM
ncbi:MAG: AAA family ATPase [Desulfobacteraceae bacterium]|nr:AAA family ATPase [Desulfobacteraceae bacterium]